MLSHAACDRLLARVMPSSYDFPLGSGAIAGTSLPLDRKQTLWFAKRFDIVDEDTNVAVSSIDRAPPRATSRASSSSACAMIAQHLSRWAEQWIIYMTTEFGFIKIADRYTTSSLDDAAEAEPGHARADPRPLRQRLRRPVRPDDDPQGPAHRLQPRPAGRQAHRLPRLRHRQPVPDDGGRDRELAPATTRPASSRRSTAASSTRRAWPNTSSRKGIPFRTAHHIVGTLVARCEKEGKHALSQLSVEAFNEVIQEATERRSDGATEGEAGTEARRHEGTKGGEQIRVTDDVYTCLGAANVVKRYQSAGAAGGKPFEEQLNAWKKRLGLC